MQYCAEFSKLTLLIYDSGLPNLPEQQENTFIIWMDECHKHFKKDIECQYTLQVLGVPLNLVHTNCLELLQFLRYLRICWMDEWNFCDIMEQ